MKRHWDGSLGKVWASEDPQVRRTACLKVTVITCERWGGGCPDFFYANFSGHHESSSCGLEDFLFVTF